jgi:hypothetical protein
MNLLEPRRMSVKVFAEEPVSVAPEALVPIFQGWVRDDALSHPVMIDVADYTHVAEGPGVILICHGGHYSYDLGGGRPGLRCTLTRAVYGGAEDPISLLLGFALDACALLEEQAGLQGALRFRTDELLFRFEDRLAAPPTTEAFREARRLIGRSLAALYTSAAEVAIEPVGAAREPLSLRVDVAGAPPLAVLRRRLGTPSAAC